MTISSIWRIEIQNVSFQGAHNAVSNFYVRKKNPHKARDYIKEEKNNLKIEKQEARKLEREARQLTRLQRRN